MNPWRAEGSDAALTPGGSSGGSAAAVAADLCLAATGTDTGGSIRQPAAFHRIVGLKPTYGRASRWGIVAFASSLDQAGPMTKTVRDAAIMGAAMMGHDPKDSTSADLPVPDFEAMLTGGGHPRQGDRHPRANTAWTACPTRFEALWTRGREMLGGRGRRDPRHQAWRTPNTPLPTYYVIAPAEASSNLARYDGVRYGYPARSFRRATASPRCTRRPAPRASGLRGCAAASWSGTYVLSAGLLRRSITTAPAKVRTLIKSRISEEALPPRGVDAILTPRHALGRFRTGQDLFDDPVQMYLNDVFTVTVEPRRPARPRGARGPRCAGPAAGVCS